MIDSHIHLNSTAFYTNPDLVVAQAKENKVEAIISVATDLSSSKISVDLTSKYKNFVFASAGVHPEEITGPVESEIIAKLSNFYKQNQVVAVGEVGLDKFYLKNSETEKEDFKNQLEWFRAQIELSILYNLPLIIHSRETTTEMLGILTEYKDKIFGVWHCFVEDLEVAKKVLNLNFLISFTGIVTYKNNKDLLEVVRSVPDDKFMIETDGPFLVPEPLRSEGKKPNMPWYVIEVAKKIAEVRGVDIRKIIEVTSNNANKLFGLELRK